jgi:hypothetical protein
MRRRKNRDEVKTGLLYWVQDELRGNLLTAWAASGINADEQLQE